MLEKITNINPESGYKNEKHSGNFLPAFSKAAKHIDLGNDAIQISPAMQYILEKGWRLKELKEINSRKILIKFLFAGFEFHCDIDFDKILITKKLFFNIIKDKDSKGTTRKLALNLTFNINKYFDINNNQETYVNLKDLEILFERITQLELESEINNFDSCAINNLLDDVNNGLVSELNYITSNLLLFFEKLLQINCRFIKQEEEILEIIKLEKISSADTGKTN